MDFLLVSRRQHEFERRQNAFERGTMKSLLRKISKKEAAGDVEPSYRSAAPPTRRPARMSNNQFIEPPPAYTPAPETSPVDSPTANRSVALPSSQSEAADDAYSFLRTFDTIFLIDDSGSMAGSRWREAADALATITPICTSHDADGIDIYFLNQPDNPLHHGVTNAATVHEIFQSVKPGGGTPTGQRLRGLLNPYIRRYEANPETTKPINVICVTDGEAHDDLEGSVVQAAQKLDKLDAPSWQVGVQFFQIGNDPAAKELLRYLDDELVNSTNGLTRDIVDTVPFRGAEGARLTGEGVLKVVLGSVNRRLDRRRSKELHR